MSVRSSRPADFDLWGAMLAALGAMRARLYPRKRHSVGVARRLLKADVGRLRATGAKSPKAVTRFGSVVDPSSRASSRAIGRQLLNALRALADNRKLYDNGQMLITI